MPASHPRPADNLTSTRASNDKFGRKQYSLVHRAQVRAARADPIEQPARGAAAEFGGRLTNRSERNTQQGGHFEIVEANDRDFVGHANVLPLQSLQDVDGGNVIESEERSWWLGGAQQFQKPGDRGRRFVRDDEFRTKSGFRHGFFVTLHSQADGVELAVISDADDAA